MLHSGCCSIAPLWIAYLRASPSTVSCVVRPRSQDGQAWQSLAKAASISSAARLFSMHSDPYEDGSAGVADSEALLEDTMAGPPESGSAL